MKASTAPSPPAVRATTEPTVGAAFLAVEALKVKGRAPKTGYDRAQFGSGWVDVDRNGCDTRNDQLKSTLSDRDMSGSCKVLAGTLADPYTDTTIRFEYGGVSEVDIDHLVALSDAWQKGAAAWPFAKRVAFANDPLNLQPTSASANRQKGDGDAATWLPSNKGYRCTYVARQAAVKTKYKVWVTDRGARRHAPGPRQLPRAETAGTGPATHDRVEHRWAAPSELTPALEEAQADEAEYLTSRSQARPAVPDLWGRQRRRVRPLRPGC